MIVALCAVFLARASATAIGGKLVVGGGAAAPRPTRVAAPAPAAPAYTKQVEEILKRNIFCSTCPPILGEAGHGHRAAAGAAAPENVAALKLLAIMFAPPPTDPRWSMAIIRDNDDKSAGPVQRRLEDARCDRRRHLRRRASTWTSAAGARVPGPARSAAAAPRRVAAAPAAPTDPLRAELDKGIKKIGEHTYEVQRATLDSLLGNMGVLSRAARIVPEMKDGKSAGFRLFSVRPDGPFAKIGLQNGDVISAINGLEMNSPDRRCAIYTKLKSANHLSVASNATVRRSPRTTTSDEKTQRQSVSRRWYAILQGASPPARGGGDGPRRQAGPREPGRDGAGRIEAARVARRDAAARHAAHAGRFRACPGSSVASGRPPARPDHDAREGTTGTAPAAGAGRRAATGSNELIWRQDFNTCKKFPANKRIVKLNLKPDTELGDLIAWISSITCKQFLLPGTIPANSKKVTVIAPELITPEEAYRLFLWVLDSVGLTVEHAGKFLRIVETAKTRSRRRPVLRRGADVTSNESYETRLVQVENVDLNEVATVLGRIKSEQGDIVGSPPRNR